MDVVVDSDETWGLTMMEYASGFIFGLTLIRARFSNHIPSKVGDEITYPLPNFNGHPFEVWEWRSNFMPLFITNEMTYPCYD